MPVILSSNIKLVTFDVFDTAVSRKFIQPHDVFESIEEKLTKAGLKVKGYALLRKQVEFDLRSANNFNREVSLREICTAVAGRLNIADCRQLESAEIDAEKDAIYPVKSIQEIIDQCRSRFGRVGFISDTYLPGVFIRKLLEEFQLLKNRDVLFCSSDHGLLKSTGELFSLVANKLDLHPHQICHIGDNIESDFQLAKSAGLSACHFFEAAATRYELKANCDLKLSRWLGVLRRVRLSPTRNLLPHEKIVWDASANVSGPLVVGFVKWCLDEAYERGITRLYFLARDGQVMKRVADELQRGDEKIDCRYLHVSRQSLLLAGMEGVETELGWILAPTTR